MKKKQFIETFDEEKGLSKLILPNKKAYSLSKGIKEELLRSLERYVNKFISEVFGGEIPFIKVVAGPRLSRTQGQYIQELYKGKVNKEYIAISNKTLSTLSLFSCDSVTLGVDAILRHEATHYALAYLGLDYKDGQADFEHTIAAIGGLTSGVTKSNDRVKAHAVGSVSSGFLKRCNECKKESFFVSDSSRYICSDCSKDNIHDYILLESVGLSVYVSQDGRDIEGQPLNWAHVYSKATPKGTLVEHLKEEGIVL